MRINVRRIFIGKTRKHPRGPAITPGAVAGIVRQSRAGSHRFNTSDFLRDHKAVQGRIPVAAFSSGRTPRSQANAYKPLDR